MYVLRSVSWTKSPRIPYLWRVWCREKHCKSPRQLKSHLIEGVTHLHDDLPETDDLGCEGVEAARQSDVLRRGDRCGV